jgi:hypothetical protein
MDWLKSIADEFVNEAGRFGYDPPVGGGVDGAAYVTVRLAVFVLFAASRAVTVMMLSPV